MRCLYDSLLVSILKGWALNRPNIFIDEKTTHFQWAEMRKQVNEWIEFYYVVTVRGKINRFTVKPMLTATSQQRPPVYNGQLEPQFSKIL